MAPPAWLPPLNSHDRYSVLVAATQTEKPWCSPKYDEPMFEIKAHVSVIFSSDIKNNATLKGLSCEEEFGVNCRYVTSDPTSSNVILELLDAIEVPFELNNLSWSPKCLDGPIEEREQIDDTDFLVHKIWQFAYEMKEQLIYNRSYNVLPLNLYIKKTVTVPNLEFNKWIAWYNEKNSADPDFEKEYDEAISRPRTIEELTYETSVRFRAAIPSSIRELEVVRLDDCSSNNCCPICLEELVLQSKVTRLRCSHVFHGDCIVKWLQESHMCPLCRFELPYV